jgi:phosphoribosylaminoimidazole-succinocarboxamide synthase
VGIKTLSSPESSVSITGLPLLRRGKVRDVYDLGDKLLIVASDRLSAFDVILPTPIPGKGKILTTAALFWFELTKNVVPNHLVTADFSEIRKALPSNVSIDKEWFDGRMMLVRKAKRIDAECVARAYLAGSGWKEYKATGLVGGHKLPDGLLEASRLPEPIFTPATKADEGHDENISREQLAKMIGTDLAKELEKLTLDVFAKASAHLAERGLILADTKFEFGFIDGELRLIDEILTPDSSRVWEQKDWKPGKTPDGFDKQYVRDWLERSGWNKAAPAPALPADVVDGTLARYREFLAKVTK